MGKSIEVPFLTHSVELQCVTWGDTGVERGVGHAEVFYHFPHPATASKLYSAEQRELPGGVQVRGELSPKTHFAHFQRNW